MAKESSFDIVSAPNWAEVLNGIDQTRREVAQRYDFRDQKVEIDYDAASKIITLKAPAGLVMDALSTVLGEKMAKRGVSLRFLDFKDPVPAGGDRAAREVHIRHGLDTTVAKTVQKGVRSLGLKVEAQIQGDAVRVSGKNKDDLQAVIRWMKGQDFGLELTADNFR